MHKACFSIAGPHQSPANRCLDDRLLGSATRCVLALMLVLAPPVASFAWLAGAHATIEQVALHEVSLQHEHTDHHGTHQHWEPRAGSNSAGLVISASAASAGVPQDGLQ